MRRLSTVLFVLLFAPSVSSAAALTSQQSSSLIAVVQSSPGTPASAFVSLITAFSNITVNQATSLITVVQAAPGVPANVFVDLLTSFTVDTVAIQPAAPVPMPVVITPPTQTNQQTTPLVMPPPQTTSNVPSSAPQSVPVQPVITVVPWFYVDGNITKNPATIPVSSPDGNGKQYQIIYTASVEPKGDWIIDLIYPTKAEGNPQGDVRFKERPSKDVNDFAYRLSGAFYAYAPGTYTTTFVAHNGTDTATTTSTIIVQ